MRFLHTMVRVKDLDKSLSFYCDALGLIEVERKAYSQNRFTLIYLAAPQDEKNAKAHNAPLIELTYNWDPEHYESGRSFGHIAFEVDDIYSFCKKLQDKGITINRPPRDGYMAFIKSPDDISVELLQKKEPLPVTEPWKDMPNIGSW